MGTSSEYFELDLRRFLQSVWHYLWAVILAAIVGGVSMFAYTILTTTPYYTAEAIMYVNSSDITIGGSSFTISTGQLSAASRLIKSYEVILHSRTTLNEIIEEAGLNYTYGQLNGMVSATALNDTEVLSIKATSTDPQEAALIANTVADVLPERVTDVMNSCFMKPIDYAIAPAKTTANRAAAKNALVGAAVGMALVCALLVVRMLFDTVIHSEDYLMETYKLPILAVVPNLLDEGKGYGYGYGYAADETKRRAEATK